MNTVELSLLGCAKIPIKEFSDDRGSFQEIWRRSLFDIEIKQINLSRSKKNVVRGLHYQFPLPQGKFIQVLNGAVIDVALDLRKNSATYGMFEQFYLSEGTHALFVPPGFAHGFLALEDTDFLYGCTEQYEFNGDFGVNPLDPQLSLPWINVSNLIISAKDKELPLLNHIESPF